MWSESEPLLHANSCGFLIGIIRHSKMLKRNRIWLYGLNWYKWPLWSKINRLSAVPSACFYPVPLVYVLIVNRRICFIAMNQVFSWTWIRFPMLRGFSVLIRNSFWTACYYLWPLDVWIDLQALGPGHCVGHVWRRSWPLCVHQGPQISCPPCKHNPPGPTLLPQPSEQKLTEHADVLKDFRNYRTDCPFNHCRCKKLLASFHHKRVFVRWRMHMYNAEVQENKWKS